MIIRTKLLFRASGITIFPFVLVKKGLGEIQEKNLLQHENVHYKQQKRWCIYGLGLGLLAWFALYLLALPVYWNPFRRKWETEAFKACGYDPLLIDEVLTKSPYYLWGLKK